MHEFRGQEFVRVINREQSAVSDYRFINCQFAYCRFSLVDNISSISTVQNVEFLSCHNCNSDIGPSILENVRITDLSISESLICWSPFFRHVVFQGKIGRVILNSQYTCVDFDPDIQKQFDAKRATYYETVDWALDISEARFSDFSMRGVPARLVRIDPETQGIVTRESVLQEGWRDKVHPKDDLWLFIIDLFLEDGDEDLVLATPMGSPRKRYQPLLDSLNELKDLGVVLNSV